MKHKDLMISLIACSLMALLLSAAFAGEESKSAFGSPYRDSALIFFLSCFGRFTMWLAISSAFAYSYRSTSRISLKIATFFALFALGFATELIRPGMINQIYSDPIRSIAREWFSATKVAAVLLTPLILLPQTNSSFRSITNLSIFQLLAATLLIALIASLVRLRFSWFSVWQQHGTAIFCGAIGMHVASRNLNGQKFMILFILTLIVVLAFFANTYVPASIGMLVSTEVTSTVLGILPFLLSVLLVSSAWKFHETNSLNNTLTEQNDRDRGPDCSGSPPTPP